MIHEFEKSNIDDLILILSFIAKNILPDIRIIYSLLQYITIYAHCLIIYISFIYFTLE